MRWLLALALFTSTARAAESPREMCAQAELVLDTAQQSLDQNERFRLADEVKRMCERAAQATPLDPEAILRIVSALEVAPVEHPELCRPGYCEEALRWLERLRVRDVGGIESARMWSTRGIVLSRMLRFADALEAYEHALPLVDAQRRPNSHDERGSRVLLWGNSAETAMALGRLDESVRRYELALDNAEYGSKEWQLAQYGLGVALDRDGQGELARRTIGKAVERDPALSGLHEEGVFFEPPGDVAYYEGLAHEVAGDRAEAKEAFERFVATLPSSPHVARAKWHIHELGLPGSSPKPAVEIGMPMLLKARRAPASVRSRVVAHVPELLTCYARALRKQPGLTVSLQLALEISPAGFIGQRAHVMLGSEQSLELSRCVELASENWRFDPLATVAGSEDEVAMVPLDFRPAPH